MTAGVDGYGAATGGTAVRLLAERSVLAVTGPQRQKFLHGIVSNDLQSLGPGQGCRAALMDVRGRQLAWMRALVAEDAVLVELPSDRLPLVEATLAHYRVAAPVRFAERPACVIALLGPQAKTLLGDLGLDPGPLGTLEAHVAGRVAGHDVRVARAGDLPRAGLVVHGALEAADALRQALVDAGARPLEAQDLDALRIEEGRAWYGRDVTDENLLHETGLLDEYHSPAKGCYVGQEVIARLEARGRHVNRALRGLRSSAPAAPGDAVTAEGTEIGRVTTAAVSPALGAIAMGYVHRSRFDPGTAVEVGGHPATVATLPLIPPK